jgi:hypothetical protein
LGDRELRGKKRGVKVYEREYLGTIRALSEKEGKEKSADERGELFEKKFQLVHMEG